MINRKQVSDSVTLVQFDHGRVSALDLEFLLALRAELAELADTGTALVLTGTGSAFSAGVDLVRLVDGGPDYVAGSSLPCPASSTTSSPTAARWWPPSTATPSPAAA